MGTQQKWLQRLQDSVNELGMHKLDSADFKEQKAQIDLENGILKEMAGTHENHFAMVENFVEKYIPVRI